MKLLLSLIFLTSFGAAQINIPYANFPQDYTKPSSNSVYIENLVYGSDDSSRQCISLFLPDTLNNYPLVIFMHGGGFRGGNKESAWSSSSKRTSINSYLNQGIAYASIGYRLIHDEDSLGVIKSLMDLKFALQFIRHYASELNIKPNEIVLSGSSAGAGAALWLGTHDDMADINASNEIEKESTRVCAIYASSPQATYDVLRWENEVFFNYDGQGSTVTIEEMAEIVGFGTVSDFYGGIDSVDQLRTRQDLIDYRSEVDMLAQISPDDPPIGMSCFSQAETPHDDLYHHYTHLTYFENLAEFNGLEVVTRTTQLNENEFLPGTSQDFVVNKLVECASPVSVQKVSSDLNNNFVFNGNELVFRFSVPKRVRVYSMSGSLVYDNVVVQSNLNTNFLSTGVYIVQVDLTAKKIIIN